MDDGEDENDGLHKKDKSKIILGEYPGPINSMKELRKILVDTDRGVLIPEQDAFDGLYLKPGMKED